MVNRSKGTYYVVLFAAVLLIAVTLLTVPAWSEPKGSKTSGQNSSRSNGDGNSSTRSQAQQAKDAEKDLYALSEGITDGEISNGSNRGVHRRRVVQSRHDSNNNVIIVNNVGETSTSDQNVNGETSTGEDNGNNSGVSAVSNGNGAEASTPGAVASAGGNPDNQAPVSGPQGDVVDEVPTSGELPNTDGANLLAYSLPALGCLLLLVAIARKMRSGS
jgi:hypothetical protein